jgi:hypothetical protein
VRVFYEAGTILLQGKSEFFHRCPDLDVAQTATKKLEAESLIAEDKLANTTPARERNKLERCFRRSVSREDKHMQKHCHIHEPERGDKPAEIRDTNDGEGVIQIASALILQTRFVSSGRDAHGRCKSIAAKTVLPQSDHGISKQ